MRITRKPKKKNLSTEPIHTWFLSKTNEIFFLLLAKKRAFYEPFSHIDVKLVEFYVSIHRISSILCIFFFTLLFAVSVFDCCCGLAHEMENLSPILMPSAIDLIFKQILICQIADECFEPTIRWRWCIYTESIFFGLCERTFDDWWRTKCLKLRILYMDSQFSIRIHSSYIFIQYKFSQTIVLSVFSTHVVAFSFSFFFAFYHV